MIDPAKAALEILDAARRRTGRRLDEAGYGPLLGPLVVGCCAFELEPEGGGGSPSPPDWNGPVTLASSAAFTADPSTEPSSPMLITPLS